MSKNQKFTLSQYKSCQICCLSFLLSPRLTHISRLLNKNGVKFVGLHYVLKLIYSIFDQLQRPKIYLCLYIMNKIENKRYLSLQETFVRSPQNQQSKNSEKSSFFHDLSTLIQTQSKIELIKKRISALCLRDQKYTHKALNTQMKIQKKQVIKKQSQKIQKLIARQRKKQEQYLAILKYKNVQSRAQNYFKIRTLKQKKEQQARELSNFIRSKSKEYTNVINQQKLATIQNKRKRKNQISHQQSLGRLSRSRILQQKKESAQACGLRQVQRFAKLEKLKENQLKSIQKLQLTMVEKTNASKAAYQASQGRLSANSRYNTEQKLKTQRTYYAQKANNSVNYF